MISQYQDFVVMRYADVLLMAAELGSPTQTGICFRRPALLGFASSRRGLCRFSDCRKHFGRERRQSGYGKHHRFEYYKQARFVSDSEQSDYLVERGVEAKCRLVITLKIETL